MTLGCQQVIPDPPLPDPKEPEAPDPGPPAVDCVPWTEFTVDDLELEGLQLLQVIEVGDEIPLITGRPFMVRALLRHTGEDNEPLEAPIQVTVHVANESGHFETVIAKGPDCVPAVADLKEMSSTYNAVVPAEALEGTVSVYATVSTTGDGGGEIPGLRWPPEGSIDLAVVEPTPFHLTLVPITYGDVPADIDGVDPSAYLTGVYARFPLDEVDAVFREPFLTDSIEDETWQQASSRILRELDQLRRADESDRHYYGLLPLAAFSPGGGRGFIGRPVAIGRDISVSGSRSGLISHELGHNFGLQHVPRCDGSLEGADPDYPHEKGQIGVYGYDWDLDQLMLPTSGDVMSYCPPWWISDYHYKKILDFRAAEAMSAGTGEGSSSQAR